MQAVQILVTLSLVSTVSGNMCVVCAAGKYRFGGSSSAPCLPCPANTFSARVASAECEACPMHTFSAPGSASCEPDACVDDVDVAGCFCAAGRTGADGGPCTACGRDTFKNRTGSSNCTSCAVNETAAEGSAGCVCKENYFGVSGACAACPLQLVSPANSTECFCADGALLRDGKCGSTFPGRLKLTGIFANTTNTSMSPAEIDDLKAAMVVALAAQYNTSAHLVQIEISTDESGRMHVSVLILFDSAEALAAAELMNVNNTMVSQGIVQWTVEQEYGQIEYGQFVRCAAGMRVVNGSCACVAGYQERGGQCVACSAGSYKALTAKTECLECAGNGYSRAASPNCTECPPFSLQIEGHTRCVCGVGFVLYNNECVELEPAYVRLSADLSSINASLLLPDLTVNVIASIVGLFDVNRDMLFVSVDVTVPVYFQPTTTAAATTTPPPESETNTPPLENETSTPPPESETSTPPESETSTPPPESETSTPPESETSTPPPEGVETSTPPPEGGARRRLLQNSSTTPTPPDSFRRRVTISCVCPKGIGSLCDQCLLLQEECFPVQGTEFCGEKDSGRRVDGYLDYTGVQQSACADGEVLVTDVLSRSKVCATKSTDTDYLLIIVVVVPVVMLLLLAFAAGFRHRIYVLLMPRAESDGVIHWKGAQAYEQVPSARPETVRPPPFNVYDRQSTAPPLQLYAVYDLHFNK